MNYYCTRCGHISVPVTHTKSDTKANASRIMVLVSVILVLLIAIAMYAVPHMLVTSGKDAFDKTFGGCLGGCFSGCLSIFCVFPARVSDLSVVR